MQSPLMSREDFLKDETPGIVLWAERTEFKFDEEWLRNWVEQQPQWESFEHFNMLYSAGDVYDAVLDAEDEGFTIKYAPDGKQYLSDYGVDEAFIEESDRIAEYYAEMEKQKASPDSERSADEMEEYHKWLEEEQRNADIYHQEISDSLTIAEESLDANAAKELRSVADELHISMKHVEEAEETCGPDQETWNGYAPRHEKILQTIEQAGDAKSAGKSEEECSTALLKAQESMREGTVYMQERCELILQREKEYQEQLEGLRRRIAELEWERELRVQSPAELARCLAASTEFLTAIEKIRKEAKTQPRITASNLFAASRDAVKETYDTLKRTPTKIKEHLVQQTRKAVNNVLLKVAAVFDRGIAALEERRTKILEKTIPDPVRAQEEQKKENAELSPAERSFLAEKEALLAQHKKWNPTYTIHTATKLAEQGMSAKDIADALQKHAPDMQKLPDAALRQKAAEKIVSFAAKAVRAEQTQQESAASR